MVAAVCDWLGGAAAEDYFGDEVRVCLVEGAVAQQQPVIQGAENDLQHGREIEFAGELSVLLGEPEAVCDGGAPGFEVLL